MAGNSAAEAADTATPLAPREGEGRVWYAGYGSSLSERRLLQFIRGGIGVSGVRTDPLPSDDQGGPEDSRPFSIGHELYFGGRFDAYGGTAAALLEPGSGATARALGRVYNVRWSQFVRIWSTENLTASAEWDQIQAASPDYETAVAGEYDNGSLTYGRILRLGNIEGLPVLATTSSVRRPLGEPSDRYLRVIIRGLRETYRDMSEGDVLDYVASLPGVAGRFSWSRLSAVARRKSVAVVGGGIAGLYCAHQLSKLTGAFDITVLEASATFGGRIETIDMNGFVAEYGPMRFETATQPLLSGLVNEVIGPEGFESFPPMGSDSAVTKTAAERCNFRHDELRHTHDIVGTDPVVVLPDPFDLLRLGVLRMFREPLCEALGEADPFAFNLNADTTAPPPVAGRWDNEGSACDTDWTVVPAVLGGVDVRERRTKIQRWLDDLDDIRLLGLRQNARLRGVLLRDQAFWNAMSLELSPAAIRYIRDEGNFYHLFPDNPSAVEWGIFWLRLFHTGARHLSGIAGGTGELVRKLVERLKLAGHVKLQAAQEVIAVESAQDSVAVELTVRDHRGGREYRLEVDRCVLALPLAPLRSLDKCFPEQIRSDLDSALGFPLLKCFLQVRSPWWRAATRPHTGVSGLPTRELHFKWRPPANPGDTSRGLVMLYTDHPASEFWTQYVELPVHDRAHLGKHDGPLKRALVFHLLIQARRQAHLDLKELLLDTAANQPAELPVDTASIDRYVSQIEQMLNDPQVADAVRGWYDVLIGESPALVTLTHVERVLDVLRNPSPFQDVDQLRETAAALLNLRIPDSELLTAEATRAVTAHTKTDAKIAAAAESVELWGIRDWARWPVGAGCHAWRVGARSWEVMDRLDAFPLVGRPTNRLVRNVHVCGEATSDYQGFIEGALRSTQRVVVTLFRVEEEW